MKSQTILRCLLPLAFPAALSAADLKLAALFSDHMVLQRDKPVPVWGWADPGEKITVAFGGQTKTATADPAGKWTVKLDPMPAAADARELTVASSLPDRKVAVADVLVGEVWLGSGQSNMAMNVRGSLDFPKEQAAANLPRIRMFREESKPASAPQPDATGRWSVCTPESVGGFSATLFFFGRELHRELGVPVGLINSSVGGTPIESWIAAETQAATPELKAAKEASAREEAKFDEAKAKAAYDKAVAKWKQQAEKAKADGKPAPKQPQNPIEQRKRRGSVGGLFHGKVAPLVPYAIRGAVWYQGEANAHPARAELYQHQLATLVTDWRKRWNDEFPFAWVQLPNYNSAGEGWPRIRESMLKTLRLPRTGMAVTIDIGMPGNIHPVNKQEVGRRLSLWALGDVYQKAPPSTCGPLPAGHQIRGGEAVLSFTHADGGLKAKEGALAGFEIAGEDRAWKPATARIEGDKVVVSHPEVAKPAAVRYAWTANPVCNLVNGAGLPASPFRTDDWPAVAAAPAPAPGRR